MGYEEPVTQQPSSDSPEQDSGAQTTQDTENTQDTSVEDGGLKPADDPLAPPKYKP